MAYGAGSINLLQNVLRQAVILDTVFIPMGKLAKVEGQGMPDDMIAMATGQAKEFQLAYDLIKKNRNMN